MSTCSRLASKEFFLFLLPLFFALHAYRENAEAMPFREALSLFAWFSLAGAVLTAVSYLLFRSRRKAALFGFSLLFFNLFFGAAHDAIKNSFPNAFIAQYSFVLPVSLLGFAVLFFVLKKSRRRFHRLSAYLNLLFVLLILLDVPGLLKAANKTSVFPSITGTVSCDTCTRPDIYFIIADEYADSTSLQQIFGFNNGPFQAELRNRGFHLVNNSSSNYNYTPFAVASLVGMNYLTGIEGRNQSRSDRNRCADVINKNGLWRFLQDNGYVIKNHSVFNVANLPTEAPENYVLIGKALVLSQTFLGRLNRDLRYHLALTFKLQSEQTRLVYFMQRCNEILLNGLLNETNASTAKPRFVYAHLNMPHYPYYFRKDGQPNPVSLITEGNQWRQREYIEYLQYCNKVFLSTIDTILQRSAKPPVIVFMGDHGFRQFRDGSEKNAPFFYKNLNAVLLPQKNYSKFYDGISGVNQFRALLNTLFAQQLPMLKDSTILLRE